MKNKKIENEIILTSICTIIFMIILYRTRFYSHFFNIQDDIKQLILYSLSFLVTIIGVILAVHALLVTLFNRSIIKNIKEKDIKIVLDSFVVLIKMVIFNIFWLLILYFIVLSEKEIVNIYVFYLISIMTFWLFFYIIFIVEELVKNINKLFDIKNNCEKIEEIKIENENQDKKVLFLIQDYLLKKIITSNSITEFQLKTELYNLLNKLSISEEEKEKLKKYLDNYYNWK